MARDYIPNQDAYDNSMPLFLGGPLDGEIRLVGSQANKAPDFYKCADEVAAREVTYARWSLTVGRVFVFYRLLGMSDSAAVERLIALAMRGVQMRDESRLATGIWPLAPCHED